MLGVSACSLMAFFKQASVLATDWANVAELREQGAQGSLCVVKGCKLRRSSLLCFLLSCELTRRPEGQQQGSWLGCEAHRDPSKRGHDGTSRVPILEPDNAEGVGGL